MITILTGWNGGIFPLRNLLVYSLMWSCSVEIRDVGTQDTVQLLLMEDHYLVQALSPHTPQKAFTDGIGSWRMIWRFEYLHVARCCHTGETGPKLAIVIANEIFRRLSIRSRLAQLLCGPNVGRRARHTYVNDFPRSQFDDKEGKQRTKEQVSNL